ncbi:expressed unknown protein [Seminavis robusta]|uniref:Uncharacterized protein n=1 Tax=Seminavis robusta TaxID=568900 RepID=A0A9N8DFC2_9STRA|nr:expressed unknown protein [Seminavis robusta]|eukprot:Sro91_g047750.1 n/a (470) ;mRNA; f:70215-71624
MEVIEASSDSTELLQDAIRSNATRLCILLEDIDVVELTQVLRGPLGQELSASGICSIALDGENYAGWEDTRAMEDLLDVFGTVCQGLTKYEFECFVPEVPTPEHLFPVRVLTRLLRQVRGRLEILRLNEVVLHATQDEYREFLQVVRTLKCLRCCFLQDTVSIMVDMEPRSFDEVLLAIAQLPLIVEVSMETDWCNAAGDSRLETTQSIQALCSSPTIQCLSFDNMHPNNHAFMHICQTLQTNTALQILHIKFAQFGSNNHNMAVFCDFLQSNRGLRELELEFQHSLFGSFLDPILIAMAKGIAQNPHSTLHTLDIRARQEFGATVEDALLQLMRTNYVIESLGIVSVDEDGQERTYEPRRRTELDLFARLNGYGRKKLMASQTRRPFVHAFATQLSHDLDGLYYYLRIHPWLCQADSAPAPPPRNKKKRRLNNPSTTTTAAAQDDELEQLRRENAALKAKLARLGETI